MRQSLTVTAKLLPAFLAVFALAGIFAVAPALARDHNRVYPDNAYRIASEFQSTVNMDGSRRVEGDHMGIDIPAPRGTPVYSPVWGRVHAVYTDFIGSGGKTVWIDTLLSSPRFRLVFAHLDEQLVRPNALVRPGELIGTVGNTGGYPTSHLHIGALRLLAPSGWVDPAPLLFRRRGGAPVCVDPKVTYARTWGADSLAAGGPGFLYPVACLRGYDP